MKQITLQVEKQAVYDEVAQTTAYTGSKMDADEKAYERISTTSADGSQLDRFWTEAKATVAQRFKKQLTGDAETDGVYAAEMEVSDSFDDTLLGTMETDLFSFFVMFVAGKWFAMTNRNDAADTVAQAGLLLESVHRKVVYKVRPTRPTYN